MLRAIIPSSLPARVAALAALLALTGCIEGGPAGADPAPGASRAGAVACSPRDWTTLVGKKAAAVSLPQGLTHRILQSGAMVLDDYQDDRLNIVTDAKGTVISVSCG